MQHRYKSALVIATALTLPLVTGCATFAGATSDDTATIIYHSVPTPLTPAPAPVAVVPPSPAPELPVAIYITPDVAALAPANAESDADYAYGTGYSDLTPDGEPELAPEATPPAGAEWAEVTRVIDGDTIEVSLGGVTERVRLVDIDSPERGAAGFTEATNFTRDAIAAANNVVYLQRSGNNRDRFDRLRRNVWLRTDHGFVLLNDLLVANGHAQVRIIR